MKRIQSKERRRKFLKKRKSAKPEKSNLRRNAGTSRRERRLLKKPRNWRTGWSRSACRDRERKRKEHRGRGKRKIA
jgi:hypothetical protein